MATSFPQFANLPAEIQLQIWASTTATLLNTPQMHAFDVRAPSPPSTLITTPAAAVKSRGPRQRSPRPNSRVRKARSPPPRRKEHPLLESVTLNASGNTANPSAYKFRDVLRHTCVDAAAAAARAQAAIPAADRAAVELPGGRSVVYDNARDVLHLRFLTTPPIHTTITSGGGLPTPPPSRSSSPDGMEGVVGSGGGEEEFAAHPLSALFQSIWSRPLATALHAARRIAIDVSQIWPSLAEDQHKLVRDIVFFVCTVQHQLEVLYLVDSSRPPASSKDLANKCSLYERFHRSTTSDELWEAEEAREGPDAIHGCGGAVWREVFDLEGLGWHESHPGFVFGEVFGEVVRLQQGNCFGEPAGEGRATFKGVRVLIAEEA